MAERKHDWMWRLVERFVAMTGRALVGDDYCVVWKDGDTFRMDDDTGATPARYCREALLGERLEVSATRFSDPRNLTNCALPN